MDQPPVPGCLCPACWHFSVCVPPATGPAAGSLGWVLGRNFPELLNSSLCLFSPFFAAFSPRSSCHFACMAPAGCESWAGPGKCPQAIQRLQTTLGWSPARAASFGPLVPPLCLLFGRSECLWLAAAGQTPLSSLFPTPCRKDAPGRRCSVSLSCHQALSLPAHCVPAWALLPTCLAQLTQLQAGRRGLGGSWLLLRHLLCSRRRRLSSSGSRLCEGRGC